MDNLLWAIGSLVIAVPVLALLPIGISFKGKLILASGALMIGLAGLYGTDFLQLWQLILVFALLAFLASYFLNSRLGTVLFGTVPDSILPNDFAEKQLTEPLYKESGSSYRNYSSSSVAELDHTDSVESEYLHEIESGTVRNEDPVVKNQPFGHGGETGASFIHPDIKLATRMVDTIGEPGIEWEADIQPLEFNKKEDVSDLGEGSVNSSWQDELAELQEEDYFSALLEAASTVETEKTRINKVKRTT